MTNASARKEQNYWDNWIDKRDPQAGDELVQRYMPLVYYQVQRIAVSLPKTVNKQDLISFGLMGLYDALERFDPSRDLKFDTYASFRIRGAILDGLRKEDWLPRSTREKAKKIEAAIAKMEQRHMRTVTAKEVADELGMTEEEVCSVMNEGFFANILSLDDWSKENEEEENSPLTLRDEKTSSPEEAVLRQEMYEQLAAVIKQLNEKEQLVISLFYKEELTLTEIGQIMGLSTSRISQIHSKAIFKLRKILTQVL
ncbi:RNA polymerase sigma-D factor [Anoxybacillus sp. B7M1]|jgi:RNA polymerase sigma factor FliA|uniref:RNA polymerase sigma factor n=1 Tax=Anoxybacteroides rupiense TaxID=311460 RepID=A0ABT5W1D7_9BACL|nr:MULTISPECIES: FliA/WhiG family RNA polymerase sigma factor [Anoxybacillus]ANB58429.1 RNA polymerase sigma-D factor [Anoxybacillus sp. B2M1]ANB64810.1 RNA polymerase sigma-D factor [Anoxybacillus sp. B7M1]KXG10574.1 RNA polymerase sigma-D factor [Anoxybacillus sp. P3H1B]MBB3906142.1 RNA polymerase sigma factor for flagellar operon FliA [Anoxybacillus rupiensis]MBS2771033.1 FliA/WhiG family RNA polymerase sigma factor [Anoxybacillus rupiensis]